MGEHKDLAGSSPLPFRQVLHTPRQLIHRLAFCSRSAPLSTSSAHRGTARHEALQGGDVLHVFGSGLVVPDLVVGFARNNT